ncbi:hypothetical protein IJG14_06155 [bacterium]|nr:hypothetical protein [bacterium]
MTNYQWIDNPTVSQVAEYNPDILNNCLMHLKYNNIPSNKHIFCFNKGNVNSDGCADLIDAQLSTNRVFSQAGQYSINIPVSGNYDVVLVGAGAGGAWGMDVYAVRSSASGGSGAAFVGNIYIPAGTYSCTVGAGGASAGNGGTGGAGGDTSIGSIISAGGGSAGAYATWGNRRASSGGTMSVNTTINSSTLNSSGNNGTTAYNASSQGGQSLYNGYGQGGSATTTSASKGVDGFLSIKLNLSSYINYKIGGSYPNLLGTTISGENFTLTGLNSDDASSLADGTYNKFLGSDGSSELLKNTIYRQAQSPTARTGDIWINTSQEPFVPLKWNGSAWVSYSKIPLGTFTVSNGTITSYKTFSYNQNGYNLNSRSPLGKPSGKYINIELPASGSTLTAPYTGLISIMLIANAVQFYNTSRGGLFHGIANQNSGACGISIPCQKGDTIKVHYSGYSSLYYFKCFPDEGAV